MMNQHLTQIEPIQDLSNNVVEESLVKILATTPITEDILVKIQENPNFIKSVESGVGRIRSLQVRSLLTSYQLGQEYAALFELLNPYGLYEVVLKNILGVSKSTAIRYRSFAQTCDRLGITEMLHDPDATKHLSMAVIDAMKGAEKKGLPTTALKNAVVQTELGWNTLLKAFDLVAESAYNLQDFLTREQQGAIVRNTASRELPELSSYTVGALSNLAESHPQEVADAVASGSMYGMNGETNLENSPIQIEQDDIIPVARDMVAQKQRNRIAEYYDDYSHVVIQTTRSKEKISVIQFETNVQVIRNKWNVEPEEGKAIEIMSGEGDEKVTVLILERDSYTRTHLRTL